MSVDGEFVDRLTPKIAKDSVGFVYDSVNANYNIYYIDDVNYLNTGSVSYMEANDPITVEEGDEIVFDFKNKTLYVNDNTYSLEDLTFGGGVVTKIKSIVITG